MPSWDVHFETRVDAGSPEVISLVAECRALASVISNIPITPRRQDKIDRLNILRAVRGTTGIEGAQLTQDEVGRIMDASARKRVLPPNREREEQEARNADELMKYVARLLARYPDCPLSEQLIRKLHHITTHKIDYPHNTPGKYRTFAVTVANYVPPSEENEIRQLMSEFIRWFNDGPPSAWPPIIRAVIAHFYVVSIHPFGEGNGRTSRAVESFLLLKAGINARGFYSLANYYYQHRQEYVEHLDQVRFDTDDDLTPFVLFALRGLAEELEAVHQEVMLEVRSIAFRDFVRDTLQDRLVTKAGERMLNFVIGLGDSHVSLRAMKRGEHPLAGLYHGLTSKTISRDINYLIENELIVVEDGNIRANLDVMGKYTPPYELM